MEETRRSRAIGKIQVSRTRFDVHWIPDEGIISHADISIYGEMAIRPNGVDIHWILDDIIVQRQLLLGRESSERGCQLVAAEWYVSNMGVHKGRLCLLQCYSVYIVEGGTYDNDVLNQTTCVNT